jgi:integrase
MSLGGLDGLSDARWSEVKGLELRTHTLRHTFAHKLVEARVNGDIVKASGHTPTITTVVYAPRHMAITETAQQMTSVLRTALP